MRKFVHCVCKAAPKGSWGIVEGDKVHIIGGSPLGRVGRPRITVGIEEIERYLPPVDPVNVLCIGANYAEHVKESDKGGPVPNMPDHPLLFIKPTTAVCGHKDKIILPKEAPNEVDYEAELVAVIGETARNVPEDKALEYVIGYTCGNDISARDCQLRVDRQWARGKSFDTFAPVGPFLVTDLDPADMRIQMRLNGQTMQDSSTNNMIFRVAHLVSYLSRQMTLLPGTLLFTGTPDGVGMARNPQVFLKPGDVCEVEIPGIGVLRNEVAAEA